MNLRKKNEVVFGDYRWWLRWYCYFEIGEWGGWYKINVVFLGIGVLFNRRNRKYICKIKEGK